MREETSPGAGEASELQLAGVLLLFAALATVAAVVAEYVGTR